MEPDLSHHALVVVDAQTGFADRSWGPRNDPSADNIVRLAAHWRRCGRPLVHVRHDSDDPGSPLHPSRPCNRLESWLSYKPDLLIAEQVN